MAIILALEELYGAVTTRIANDHSGEVVIGQPPPVHQAFGWREPARQRASRRSIIWVPGDDSSGEVGKLGAAKYPGRNPRPLATLYELFTVYIAAQDPAAPADDALQYRATRLLLDEWLRAVYLAARGTYEILKTGWVSPERVQHRYGAAVRVLGAIQSMIPDYTHEAAPADTQGVITIETLDHSETFEAPEDP